MSNVAEIKLIHFPPQSSMSIFCILIKIRWLWWDNKKKVWAITNHNSYSNSQCKHEETCNALSNDDIFFNI